MTDQQGVHVVSKRTQKLQQLQDNKRSQQFKQHSIISCGK
jgi:hypothetical protein